MKVEKIFKLLKREFLKVNLLQAALDSITFFLAGNLILFLFSLSITTAIKDIYILASLSTVFFLIDLFYRSRKYNIEIYEQKNPELREILRTARDNMENKDIGSQALFEELKKRSQKVTSESIIPSKRIVQKIFLVGALSFLTVLSGLTDFQFSQNDAEIIEDLGPLGDVTGQNDENDNLTVRNGTEVLGESQDIKVSDNLIDYNITGSGDNENSELESSQRGPEEPALDVSGRSITDDLELAKEYSLEIKALN